MAWAGVKLTQGTLVKKEGNAGTTNPNQDVNVIPRSGMSMVKTANAHRSHLKYLVLKKINTFYFHDYTAMQFTIGIF